MRPDVKSLSLLIGGRAGDGINEAGMLAGRVLCRLGYYAFQYYDYPSLIRGGHNFSLVRASPDPVGAPLEKVDLILALNQDTLDRHRQRLEEGSVIIYDSSLVPPDTPVGGRQPIPLKAIMKELGAPPIMRNSCLLGAFVRSAGIPWGVLEEVIRVHVPAKTDLNLAMAQRGYQLSRKLIALEDLKRSPLPLISGNEAISLGLLKGGLEAYVAYPMTPSTSILHTLARMAREFKIQVIHPENEIAVMLMALGLAYAGRRTAIGTSGGGFCLMTEGLSLSGQAEVPMTLVISQRPGPSTGIPTYTAQSDLGFVLNAGQGEFPRLIVAPGNAEEAMYWSALALNLSWKWQIPAFILVDKSLSESGFCLDPNQVKEVPFMEPMLWDGQGTYRRYLLTPSGVSPLAFPGNHGVMVKANSYAHDEMGLTTEEGSKIESMQEKRLRKASTMEEEIQGYETIKVGGDTDSPTALICWGSTAGACLEAGEVLGLKVIRPILLHPFPKSAMKTALKDIDRYLLVEGNSTGQLANLMACRGFTGGESVLKYDGRPFFADALISRLREVIT